MLLCKELITAEDSPPGKCAAYNINLALVFLLVSVRCDTTLATMGMKE